MDSKKKKLSFLAIVIVLMTLIVLWESSGKKDKGVEVDVEEPQLSFKEFEEDALVDGVYILSDKTQGDLMNFSEKYNVPMTLIKDPERYKEQLSSVEHTNTTIVMIEDGVEASRAVVANKNQPLEYILVSSGVLNFAFEDSASNIFESIDQEEAFLLELTDNRCVQCMENSDVSERAANEKVLPYARLDIGNIHNRKVMRKDGRVDIRSLNVLPTYILFKNGKEAGRVEGVKNVDSLTYFIEENIKKEPHN